MTVFFNFNNLSLFGNRNGFEKRRLVAIAAACSFIFSGCSPARESKISADTATGIVNGQVVNSDPRRNAKTVSSLSSRVVMISYETADDGVVTCTGALLPGNVVLTAAHCIAPHEIPMLVGFGTQFNLEKDLPANYVTRPVVKRTHHPDYDSIDDQLKAGADLGMVKFSGKMPAGYSTFEVPGSRDAIIQAATLRPDDTLFMIGFGVTSYNSDDSGTLRYTTRPGSARLKSTDYDEPAEVITVSQPQNGVCSGDSGGPLAVYRKNTPVLVGITSAVGNSTNDSDSALCNGQSYFISVNLQRKWITKTYRELKATK
jgi:V8-like Glu-specific endopeptidase